jgi:hypothetical protein
LGCCWRFQLNIDRIVQVEDIVNGNAEANAAFLATALVQFPSLQQMRMAVGCIPVPVGDLDQRAPTKGTRSSEHLTS